MNNLRHFFSNNRWFLLIALLSLLLKVVLLIRGDVANPDGVLYIAAAEKHAQGLFSEGLSYYRMPFYPLLLAAIHFVVSDWVLAGQLLTTISLVLVLLPLYALARRLFNHQSALWTILMFAVLPEFNTISIMRDPLFLLFILSSLLFLVIFYQDHKFKAISGFLLFSVLAVLTRIEGVLLLAIFPIVLMFYWWSSRRSNGCSVRLAIPMVLIVIVFSFVLLGVNTVGISTNLRLDEVSLWVKDLISFNFMIGYQQLMESLRELQQALPGGSYHNNLLEVTRHYAPFIYLIGLLEILVKAVFPTSLLAFLTFRWKKSESLMSSDRWLIFFPWFTFVLLNILFLIKKNFIQTRYFWVPIVLALPWIGYGINLWWQERQQRKIVVTVVLVLIIMAPLSKTIARSLTPQDTTVISAGIWLKKYDPLRQIMILYNDSRLPLYAGRVSEVNLKHELESLRKLVQHDKDVDLVALYLSNKKKKKYSIGGFESLKIFRGDKKTVVILKRLSNGDS